MSILGVLVVESNVVVSIVQDVLIQDELWKYVGVCTMMSALARQCAYRGLYVNWMSDPQLSQHCQGLHFISIIPSRNIS